MTNEFFTWRAKHFVKVTDYSWRPKGPDTEKRIRDQLALHAVSIKLEDAVQGIPEPLFSEVRFAWDDAHFKRIENFTKTLDVLLPNVQLRVATSEGSYLAILRQMTSGVVYANDADGSAFELSSKRIDALEALIDSVQGPVLVAAYYRAEVNALLGRFHGKARAFVGSTHAKERVALIDDWNADRIPVLIAAPSAMGHGINLQHGTSRTIVWYTHTFDWAQRAQFNARLVRSGQSKVISIVSLVADSGIDRIVLNSLAAKHTGEQAILEALDIKHRLKAMEVQHAVA